MTPAPGGTKQHREAWELLPWYLNGTLSQTESTGVEAHLAGCAQCQAELARTRALAAGVREQPQTWAPSARHFAQIQAHLRSNAAALATPPQLKDTLQDWIAQLRSWFDITPRPMRFALALQAALVLALGGALLIPATSMFAPRYETHSRVDESASAGGAQLRIVFAEDITEKELRALLTAAGATIIAGPSPIGVYTIRVAEGESKSGANNVTIDSIQKILSALRANAKVRLVEAVSSGN